MRRIQGIVGPVAAVLALYLWTGVGLAERFVIVPGDKANLVKFESSAPLESFEGKTREISGSFEFDTPEPGDSVRVYVEVDLASLDTGIGLRNKHMRENHLETDKFPKAVFRGGTIRDDTFTEDGKTTSFELEGKMEIHGVTRDLRASVEMMRQDDGRLHVVSRFDIELPDYEISRPKFLVLKLDETQKITVDVVAVPAGAPE